MGTRGDALSVLLLCHAPEFILDFFVSLLCLINLISSRLPGVLTICEGYFCSLKFSWQLTVIEDRALLIIGELI